MRVDLLYVRVCALSFRLLLGGWRREAAELTKGTAMQLQSRLTPMADLVNRVTENDITPPTEADTKEMDRLARGASGAYSSSSSSSSGGASTQPPRTESVV